MQATLLYYYYLFCLIVTVCRVSSRMLKVHRTLPCKLEHLLFLTRKNLHSGEAVPGVRCEVWRCYWSCWNVVKCNQFKRCKCINIPTGVVTSFLGICHNFAKHTLVYGCCTSASTLCSCKSCASGLLWLFCKKAHVASVLSRFCWCFSIKFSEHIFKKTHLQCGVNTQWARGGN